MKLLGSCLGMVGQLPQLLLLPAGPACSDLVCCLLDSLMQAHRQHC